VSVFFGRLNAGGRKPPLGEERFEGEEGGVKTPAQVPGVRGEKGGRN